MLKPEYYKDTAKKYEDEACFSDGWYKNACLLRANLYWYLYEVAKNNPQMDEDEAIEQYNRENEQ